MLLENNTKTEILSKNLILDKEHDSGINSKIYLTNCKLDFLNKKRNSSLFAIEKCWKAKGIEKNEGRIAKAQCQINPHNNNLSSTTNMSKESFLIESKKRFRQEKAQRKSIREKNICNLYAVHNLSFNAEENLTNNLKDKLPKPSQKKTIHPQAKDILKLIKTKNNFITINKIFNSKSKFNPQIGSQAENVRSWSKNLDDKAKAKKEIEFNLTNFNRIDNLKKIFINQLNNNFLNNDKTHHNDTKDFHIFDFENFPCNSVNNFHTNISVLKNEAKSTDINSMQHPHFGSILKELNDKGFSFNAHKNYKEQSKENINRNLNIKKFDDDENIINNFLFDEDLKCDIYEYNFNCDNNLQNLEPKIFKQNQLKNFNKTVDFSFSPNQLRDFSFFEPNVFSNEHIYSERAERIDHFIFLQWQKLQKEKNLLNIKWNEKTKSDPLNYLLNNTDFDFHLNCSLNDYRSLRIISHDKNANENEVGFSNINADLEENIQNFECVFFNCLESFSSKKEWESHYIMHVNP